ncbi:23S rRNA pseudouridine(955/2504/2580) synthase RluC [Galenea microaerophila]
MSQGVQFVEAHSEDEGQRIDNFLMRHLRKVPKSMIYRVIRKGEVRVNKGRIKQNYRLKAGDIVRIPPVKVPEKTEVMLPTRQMAWVESAILYEDSDLMVINKPSGIAVHGGSGIQWGLIELVRGLRPLAKRIELVHRLDRDTSGCILLAKKASVLKALHAQVREDQLKKQYLALVEGHWPQSKQKIDLPLKKNTLQSGERVVRVDQTGKASISYFQVERQFANCSLLRVRLKTGRTHQIRVHAQANGHPIIGDEKYGNKAVNQQFRQMGFKRLALHAHKLGFTHPVTEQWLEIEAPLEASWQTLFKQLEDNREGK